MSPHRPMGDFDPGAVARMLAFLIDNGLVLTNGHGAIGGMLAPVYFAPEKKVMEEAFWFSHRGGRDLLKEFNRASKAMGADFVAISTLENDRQPLVDRLVTVIGFRPMERRYLKELG